MKNALRLALAVGLVLQTVGAFAATSSSSWTEILADSNLSANLPTVSFNVGSGEGVKLPVSNLCLDGKVLRSKSEVSYCAKYDGAYYEEGPRCVETASKVLKSASLRHSFTCAHFDSENNYCSKTLVSVVDYTKPQNVDVYTTYNEGPQTYLFSKTYTIDSCQ